MKITLDIDQKILLEEIEKVLERFKVPYETNLVEKQTITEEEMMKRKASLQKFKGCLAKYVNAYTPTKGEWYEQ
jgi:hypothetical protein